MNIKLGKIRFDEVRLVSGKDEQTQEKTKTNKQEFLKKSLNIKYTNVSLVFFISFNNFCSRNFSTENTSFHPVK